MELASGRAKTARLALGRPSSVLVESRLRGPSVTLPTSLTRTFRPLLSVRITISSNSAGSDSRPKVVTGNSKSGDRGLRIEDRGLRIEDRGLRSEDRGLEAPFFRSSILDPLSSMLNP